jgi:predicted CopG family antitoxin
MSETTIGMSWKLKRQLIKMKKHEKESYEDVLWRIVKK